MRPIRNRCITERFKTSERASFVIDVRMGVLTGPDIDSLNNVCNVL